LFEIASPVPLDPIKRKSQRSPLQRLHPSKLCVTALVNLLMDHSVFLLDVRQRERTQLEDILVRWRSKQASPLLKDVIESILKKYEPIMEVILQRDTDPNKILKKFNVEQGHPLRDYVPDDLLMSGDRQPLLLLYNLQNIRAVESQSSGSLPEQHSMELVTKVLLYSPVVMVGVSGAGDTHWTPVAAGKQTSPSIRSHNISASLRCFVVL
jgi:hypothetical protein